MKCRVERAAAAAAVLVAHVALSAASVSKHQPYAGKAVYTPVERCAALHFEVFGTAASWACFLVNPWRTDTETDASSVADAVVDVVDWLEFRCEFRCEFECPSDACDQLDYDWDESWAQHNCLDCRE